MSGELLSVRLPRRIVPICVSEPMGLAKPAPDSVDAGHEGGGDGAHSGREDSELSGGGLDGDGLGEWHGEAPYYVEACDSKR